MNILEVLDSYYPKFDGPNLVLTSYCKNFVKREDASVAAIVPKYPKYKDNQSFKVIRVKSMGGPEGYRLALPKIDSKLKKFLKSKKIDIIHVHSPFTLGRYMINYGKKHNIPTLMTFHTKYKEDFERSTKLKCVQKFLMKYIMKTINSADYVLTVSEGAKEVLKSYGCTKNIEIIRNGTDLTYPQDVKQKIDEVNNKYNLQNEENVFLSVGRIVENKKLDLALKAMKIVKEKGYKFKYLVVGDGNYLETLKTHTKELNLENEVIFTGKIMDRNLLSAHYLRSDLFIFPSTFDTASLAPIEAAALKLPSLMNRGCSTAEIITENQNGFLANENAKDWADEICKIIDNKQNLDTVKENAYKQVYRTWDSVADEVYDKYSQILKEWKK